MSFSMMLFALLNMLSLGGTINHYDLVDYSSYMSPFQWLYDYLESKGLSQLQLFSYTDNNLVINSQNLNNFGLMANAIISYVLVILIMIPIVWFVFGFFTRLLKKSMKDKKK